MKEKLPDFLEGVIKQYPEVWKAYQDFGEACSNAGAIGREDRATRKTCACRWREIGGGGSFAYSPCLETGNKPGGIAASRAACGDLHRLVSKYGVALLDSGCR